jgi:isopenicillin N synthase-like dioxygenase
MEKRYDLQTDGVEMATYTNDVRQAVNEVAQNWRAFCELPDDYKHLFATSDTQRGTGYEAKDGSGPRGDKKENFDYSVRGDEFAAPVQNHFGGVALRFIESLKHLNGELQGMATDFGAQAELPTDTIEIFTRCLRYPSGKQPGEIIAEPHTDHSGYTFHLYESTSGCERLDFTGNWLSLPVATGETAAFGGMQGQLASNGTIKAMCHRVIANAVSANEGRFVIVAFVSLSKVPAYNKKKFGRLQEMDPGFNYDMRPGDFKKLFV